MRAISYDQVPDRISHPRCKNAKDPIIMSQIRKGYKIWPPKLTGKSNQSRFLRYNLFPNIHRMSVRIMNKTCFSSVLLALLPTEKYEWERKRMVKNDMGISYFGVFATLVNVYFFDYYVNDSYVEHYNMWKSREARLPSLSSWGIGVCVKRFICSMAHDCIQSNSHLDLLIIRSHIHTHTHRHI